MVTNGGVVDVGKLMLLLLGVVEVILLLIVNKPGFTANMAVEFDVEMSSNDPWVPIDIELDRLLIIVGCWWLLLLLAFGAVVWR